MLRISYFNLPLVFKKDMLTVSSQKILKNVLVFARINRTPRLKDLQYNTHEEHKKCISNMYLVPVIISYNKTLTKNTGNV